MFALRTTLYSLLLLAGSALAGLPLASPAMADAELVMIERAGCPYCALWNKQIAPIYPLTDEGKRAPLRRLDIHAPVPDGLHFETGFVFTPTFVLVENGTEVSRLEGYPGEDFFWGLLARMIEGLSDEQSN